MLNIPKETEQLARCVAAKSGTTPEEVVREAVGRQARAIGIVPERQARPVDLAKIDAITRRSASRPLLDRRSARDIRDHAWGAHA